MIRAALGLLLLPLIACGLVCRSLATNSRFRMLAALVILAALTGCANILERDARQCHAEAWTVETARACADRFPQEHGTITDTIAQPIESLNTRIRRERSGFYGVEIDGRTVMIHADSAEQAQEIARKRYHTKPEI